MLWKRTGDRVSSNVKRFLSNEDTATDKKLCTSSGLEERTVILNRRVIIRLMAIISEAIPYTIVITFFCLLNHEKNLYTKMTVKIIEMAYDMQHIALVV